MAIEPHSPIEELTEEWRECLDAYTTIPQDLRLLQSEHREDILILCVRTQNEQHYRPFRLSRSLFLEWMKDKVRQLESDES